MITFFCISTWSTCQKAKAWLSRQEISFIYRNITKEPPTEDELKKIAALGNFPIKNLINIKGQAYKKLRPDLSVMSDGEIIKLIQDNPLLMIRPLLTNGITLVTGFKEDEYLEVIQGSRRWRNTTGRLNVVVNYKKLHGQICRQDSVLIY